MFEGVWMNPVYVGQSQMVSPADGSLPFPIAAVDTLKFFWPVG